PSGITPTFLIRTDANGNQIWREEFGMDGGGNIAVRITGDGQIVTLSKYRESDWTNYWYQMMLTKWDANGEVIWQRKSHLSYVTSTWDFEILEDGSFIASGMVSGYGVFAKFSSTGDSLW